MTRRQLRDAERNGLAGNLDAPAAELEQAREPESPSVLALQVEAELKRPEIAGFTSRKQAREAERRGGARSKTTESLASWETEAEAPGSETDLVAGGEMIPALSETLQPVEFVHQELSIELSDVQVPEVEIPSAEFKGTNLFSEPSTQSIVLAVAPEAISLPIETGEITITGSIAVLTDTASNAITGSLDGMVLDGIDRQDAVTGVISIVEPISALALINARGNVGVVPLAVLRKGWWRKWALGAFALGMVIAAIIATFTIVNLT